MSFVDVSSLIAWVCQFKPKKYLCKKKKYAKKLIFIIKTEKKNRKYEKQAYFLHNYVKIVPKWIIHVIFHIYDFLTAIEVSWNTHVFLKNCKMASKNKLFAMWWIEKLMWTPCRYMTWHGTGDIYGWWSVQLIQTLPLQMKYNWCIDHDRGKVERVLAGRMPQAKIFTWGEKSAS